MDTIIKPRSATTTPNGTANPTMMRVTSEQATQWLELAYEHQRPVRQHHVEFLAEEMRRDQFIQGTQIRFVSFDGRRILIDGQHRLWAIVMSGKPQYFSVLITRSESKEDVAWLYGNTDIGMRRTGAHLLGAMELDTETGFTQRQLRYLTSAISFMKVGCTRALKVSIHRDEIVKGIRVYVPFAREYFKALDGAPREINSGAYRSSTLSIALLSFRYTQPYSEKRGAPLVEDFWQGVIHDDGIKVGDPRKIANRHLLYVRVLNNGSNVAGDAVSAGYASRYLVSCMNAYVEGRNLQKAIVSDVNAPLKLHGVPSDPDQWW